MNHPADSACPGAPLPTLPAVVARLVALYASEEYSVDEAVRTLETDPPIATRIVRLANSAYYGFSGTVGSVRRAVVLLGGVTVQAVALGTTVLRAWPPGAVPPEVEALWIHSYLCGEGCRFLGGRLPPGERTSDPETLFLAGLLHDVGKFLFLAEQPETYAALLASEVEDLRREERSRFGRDHAAAGGELLDAWRLPRRLSALVRYHHRDALRAELRADWTVLRAADEALRGRRSGEVPPGLVEDLEEHLEEKRPTAEAFYRAIS